MAVLSNISIFNTRADILLVTVIIWGLLRGPREGLIVGIICGLLQDLLSTEIFLHTLSRGIISLSAGFLKENIISENDTNYIFFVLFGSIIACVIDAWAIQFFFERQITNMWQFIAVFSVMNTVLAPVFYMAVIKVNEDA